MNASNPIAKTTAATAIKTPYSKALCFDSSQSKHALILCVNGPSGLITFTTTRECKAGKYNKLRFSEEVRWE
jgi:hypothetical protein